MADLIKEQFPEQDGTALNDALKAQLAKFELYFHNLTAKERQGRNMAEGREGYARLINKIVIAHPDELARKDDPTALQAKLDYDAQLENHRQLFMKGLEMITETQMANGIDIMVLVDAFNAALQNGRTRNSALDMSLKEVDDYNKRFGVRAESAADDTTPETPATPVV